jgi:hypothetical protein
MNGGRLELHSIYGSIQHTGDRVEAGDVMGLSPDGASVVTAPESGQVRLLSVTSPSGRRLFVQIAEIPMQATRTRSGSLRSA